MQSCTWRAFPLSDDAHSSMRSIPTVQVSMTSSARSQPRECICRASVGGGALVRGGARPGWPVPEPLSCRMAPHAAADLTQRVATLYLPSLQAISGWFQQALRAAWGGRPVRAGKPAHFGIALRLLHVAQALCWPAQLPGVLTAGPVRYHTSYTLPACSPILCRSA